MPGKKKKSRNKANRVNPIGSAVPREPTISEEDDNDDETELVPSTVLGQLGDSSSTQRAIACTALAHVLFQTPPDKSEKLIKAMSSKGALAQILALLYDLDVNVTVSAAKCLRNFGLAGELACDELIKADALTGLISLFTHERIQKSKPEVLNNLITDVFSLLVALCAHSDAAVARVMSNIHLVFSFLDANKPPLLVHNNVYVTSKYWTIRHCCSV